MNNYEFWSLILMFFYDVLTLLLLAFTVYITVFQRRLPNIAFYHRGISRDTKRWSWRLRSIDFVLENRGIELKNISIGSEPDYLGWKSLTGSQYDEEMNPMKTSEYFKDRLPFLGEKEKKSFFWCDAQSNTDVLEKPFTIIIEFDNPFFSRLPRIQRVYKFDFSSTKGVISGFNTKYDMHNVATEAARIREVMEELVDQNKKLLEKEPNNQVEE